MTGMQETYANADIDRLTAERDRLQTDFAAMADRCDLYFATIQQRNDEVQRLRAALAETGRAMSEMIKCVALALEISSLDS